MERFHLFTITFSDSSEEETSKILSTHSTSSSSCETDELVIQIPKYDQNKNPFFVHPPHLKRQMDNHRPIPKLEKNQTCESNSKNSLKRISPNRPIILKKIRMSSDNLSGVKINNFSNQKINFINQNENICHDETNFINHNNTDTSHLKVEETNLNMNDNEKKTKKNFIDDIKLEYYQICRVYKKITKKQKFVFYDENRNLIMIANAKSSYCKIMCPNTNTQLAYISIKENLTRFVLHKENANGPILMELEYTSYADSMPRSLKIKVYDKNLHNIGIPNALKNRKPKRGPLGNWNLNYGKRKIMSSIKNVIITDANDKIYTVVGKINENSLSVEAIPNFDCISVFTIGLSSFLNPHP